jgi:Uma2 family endonuclease
MQQAEPKPHPITVAEFDQMVETGVFDDSRVELIDGQLIDMPPQSPRHAASVASLDDVLRAVVDDRAQIRVRAPLIVSALSQPEPDVAVVRVAKDRYADRHPNAADAITVIEVSWSSLAIDRDVKLPMYGRARIPEYWIVDLQNDVVEVHREPHDLGYGVTKIRRRGDEAALQAFPYAPMRVADILGAVKATSS